MQLAKPDRSVGYATLLAGAAILGLTFIKYRPRKYSFRGKVVLITGGSRGLGLVMARKLAAHGAKIAICARDPEELERAGKDLWERGGEIIEIACDVRDKSDCLRAVDLCTSHFGHLDVLINNAGVIQAGPLEAQTDDDFREAMETHFWGPYYMTQAALPHLKGQKDARIINIASIGGKVAVPHLAPYCASKFALAGYSSSLRIELAKDDITVTSVFPGLMRTGSHINAKFKGQNKKEFALFSIIDALPVTSINAENAARQILDASSRGDAEAIISTQAKLAATFTANFPEISALLMSTVNRLLPGADGPTEKSTGLESTSALAPSILTANIDKESELNNELKPGESLD